MSYSLADYAQGPRDPEFNDAVHTIANTLFPCGIDVLPADKAPNTWEVVRDYWHDTGRFAVADTEDHENVFGSSETFHLFRAWHDWTHVFGGGHFTLLGEAITARIQEATLACMFGLDKAKRWMTYVHTEIITANFDENPEAIDESKLTIA